jgi:hypothetical protein
MGGGGTTLGGGLILQFRFAQTQVAASSRDRNNRDPVPAVYNAVANGARLLGRSNQRPDLAIVLCFGSFRNPANRLGHQVPQSPVDPSRSSTARKSIILSRLHGDKARFHRIRKQNTKRRATIRALRLKLVAASAPEAAKEVQNN